MIHMTYCSSGFCFSNSSCLSSRTSDLNEHLTFSSSLFLTCSSGLPVPVPWTHLAETAPSGSLTLTLMKAVTWKPGDEIVVASTGHRSVEWIKLRVRLKLTQQKLLNLNFELTLRIFCPLKSRSDQTVPFSCRHSQKENELRKIAAVSADGKTLTLTEALAYTHLGVSVTLPDGTLFQARAEVGLLTRNILVRGSQQQEWSDAIQACPDGFNTGTGPAPGP